MIIRKQSMLLYFKYYTFSLGSVYKRKKTRSMEETKNQQENIEEWLLEDKKYLTFRASISKIVNFVSGNFDIQDKTNQKQITNVKEWFPITIKKHSTSNRTFPDSYSEPTTTNNNNNVHSNNNNVNNDTRSIQTSTHNNNGQNIILKNKLIKLTNNELHLRSLSVQCQINILMSGESEFYIFTRCGEAFSSQTALCYVSKELESARKFVSFAILEEKAKDTFMIRNIKKLEIPKQDKYIKQLDICEFKFTYVDNGDNKCFLFLDDQDQHNSNLVFVGDFYEPCKHPSNIVFGSSGDLISIKKLEIKQTFRNSYINLHNAMKSNPNVQACGCCNVF